MPAEAMSSCHSAKSEEIINRVMANINMQGSCSESSGEGGIVLARRGATVGREKGFAALVLALSLSRSFTDPQKGELG